MEVFSINAWKIISDIVLAILALAGIYWKMERRISVLEVRIQERFDASQKETATTLQGIKSDISRLEQKQDKYNHLQERMIKLETKMEKY